MKRIKHTSGLYAYLHNIGVLDTGTEEQIAAARKAYWKNYKTQWIRQQRSKTSSYTILLTTEELQFIKTRAKQYKTPITPFLKLAAFSYLNQCFAVPDVLAIRKMIQLLGLTYNSIEEMKAEKQLQKDIAHNIQTVINDVELTIRQSLFHPPLALAVIAKEIRTNELLKSQLQSLLNTINNEV